MPFYKQVLLVSTRMSPPVLAETFQKAASIIINNGGIIRHVENRDTITLGYAIEDRRKGTVERHFEAKLIVQHFTASPDTLKEVDLFLKTSASIIRFESFRSLDPLHIFFKKNRKTLEQLKNIKEQKDIKTKQVKEMIGTIGGNDYGRRQKDWYNDSSVEPPTPNVIELDDINQNKVF